MTLALWVHGIKPNRSKPIVKELSRHKRPDLPPCSVGRLADNQPSRFLSYAVVLMKTSGYAAKNVFKFDRGEITQGLVNTNPVVEQDVFRYGVEASFRVLK